MRIFKVTLEQLTYGENWSSVNVEAPTAASAIRKAEATEPRVRATEVTLLAETD